LIVSSDHNSHRSQDVIVAVVTKTVKRASVETTQFLVELGTPEGQQSGLLTDSAVKCERLHSILQSRIRRTIGSLPATAMQRINDCLKAALEIS
jgi:mRNA interferase MazF